MDGRLKLMKQCAEIKEHNKLVLPRITAAKRYKFVKAIGAVDQLDENTANANMDDENLRLRDLFVFEEEGANVQFDDSIVINDFMKIKRPEFDLKLYISCVKRLYDNEYIISSDLCYLLCHAKDFTVPRNNLFTFTDNGQNAINVRYTDVTLNTSNMSPFTAKLMTLMDELLVNYSMAKYEQLNLNITYMVLFLTRQHFKGKTNYINALKKQKTHEDYVNLCPKPLSDRLPDDAPLLTNKLLMQGDVLFTLILYAYLNSSRLTRRVLVTTCIAHMKYTGLGLTMMFNKVVELYRVPEARLWDALCVADHKSMFRLADFHDSQSKGEAEDPPKTYTLFPYCRVLNGKYHTVLSNNKNHVVCYALALLIDKKLGIDKSHMREAHWVKQIQSIVLYAKGKNLAATIYEKINV